MPLVALQPMVDGHLDTSTAQRQHGLAGHVMVSNIPSCLRLDS
jgi:hypothetical protein